MSKGHPTRRQVLGGLAGAISLSSIGCDPYGLGELPERTDLAGSSLLVEIPSPPSGSAFLMMKYEVTQALYEEVMGTNPSTFIGPQRPVEQVSWEDGIALCNALSFREGLQPAYNGTDNNCTLIAESNGYRLPFEAEWEWAARGGEDYEYAGSNNLDEVAWYSENSGDETHPVGQKQPNGYGLYDMTGNVSEWCANDCFNLVEHRLEESERVLRGGSWRGTASGCKVSFRDFDTPDGRGSRLGVRLVRSVR